MAFQSFQPLSGPFGHQVPRRNVFPTGLPAGNVVLHVRGVTKDSTSTPLGGVTVSLFLTSTNALLGTTVSDGSGNYDFPLFTPVGPFYVVAYKAGSPDVAGTTVNTLVAS